MCLPRPFFSLSLYQRVNEEPKPQPSHYLQHRLLPTLKCRVQNKRHLVAIGAERP